MKETRDLRCNILVSPSEREQLYKKANDLGITLSTLVREAVNAYRVQDNSIKYNRPITGYESQSIRLKSPFHVEYNSTDYFIHEEIKAIVVSPKHVPTTLYPMFHYKEEDLDSGYEELIFKVAIFPYLREKSFISLEALERLKLFNFVSQGIQKHSKFGEVLTFTYGQEHYNPNFAEYSIVLVDTGNKENSLRGFVQYNVFDKSEKLLT